MTRFLHWTGLLGSLAIAGLTAFKEVNPHLAWVSVALALLTQLDKLKAPSAAAVVYSSEAPTPVDRPQR